MEVARFGHIKTVLLHFLAVDLAGNVALHGARTALGKSWLLVRIFLTFPQASSHVTAAFKLNQQLLG